LRSSTARCRQKGDDDDGGGDSGDAGGGASDEERGADDACGDFVGVISARGEKIRGVGVLYTA